MVKYTLKEVKNMVHPVDSFWTVVFMNPLGTRLTQLIANYTNITPTQITFISFLFRLCGAVFFLMGRPGLMVLGGISFQFGFLLDCVDGRLARLKGMESKKGKILDSVFDAFASYMGIIGLFLGFTFFYGESIFLLLGLLFLGNYWIEASINLLGFNEINTFKK